MTFKTSEQNPYFEEILDVDPKEILDHQENLELIDVRQEEEYFGELGHVPGSRLLTLDMLPAQIQSLSQKKPIIFICRSGGRSANAASLAHAHGYKNVYNMKGGMILWNEYGLDVEY